MFHHRFIYKQARINEQMDVYQKRAVERGVKLHENLGEFTAKADDVLARMHLEVDLEGFDMNNKSGYDCYTAKVCFYALGGDRVKIPVVDAHFNTHDLSQIIRNLKRAEEGFEELYNDEHCSSYDWRSQRKVMRCILSLEDQLKIVGKERERQARGRPKKLGYV